MGKKILSLLMVLFIVCTIAGCSGTAPSSQSSQVSTTSPSSSGASSSETDGPLDILDDIQVENDVFDVTITVLSDYIGEDATQEKLDEEAKEKGYKSITLNDDGSATYVMTKAQHLDMMEDITNNLMMALDDVLASGDYPNIISIEPNNDFTDFKVTLSQDEIGAATSMSVLIYATCGAMYHSFNGTQPDDIHASFVSQSTGKVIDEWSLSNMK